MLFFKKTRWCFSTLSTWNWIILCFYTERWLENCKADIHSFFVKKKTELVLQVSSKLNYRSLALLDKLDKSIVHRQCSFAQPTRAIPFFTIAAAFLAFFRPSVDLFSSFLSVLLAVDENDTHASATHTSTTTITTTTTTTTTTSNTIITNRAKAKLKFPKSTLNRPQPLYSQKIVIGSEELAGRDIEHVVRQRINALINERSPKVVRSTALIIKSSKAPASANGRIPIKKSPARDDKNTRVEVSELDGRGSTMTTTTKTANGCANLAVRSVLSNGFDRQKAGGKSAPRDPRMKENVFYFLFLYFNFARYLLSYILRVCRRWILLCVSSVVFLYVTLPILRFAWACVCYV